MNFVDPFVRKGCRIKGRAEIAERGSAAYDALIGHFGASDLLKFIGAVVTIRVERCSPLISPAYDRGQTESDLRRSWTRRFRSLQPGGRFTDE